MINGTNVFHEDNPPLGGINLPATWSWAIPSRSVAGWLACIVRRIGARLFKMNDAEAHWRGWEIVELRGGMSRRYRDRRFATHAAPGEATLRPWDPQSPCEPRPPVPEPPGIHEDGGNCS
jgi:hypothetical protein